MGTEKCWVMCCLKWTSCNRSSPPCTSRSSEPHWVWTQGHHATLLCLFSLDTRRVSGSYLLHPNFRRKKTCSSQSSCLGKRKPRRNDSRQLGTRYENDFYRTDIPQLLGYLSDFGEDGSMWWELVPTLWSKQKSSCSLKTTYTLPHAFLTLHMKGGWIRPTRQICSACQGWVWGRDKVRKKGSH